MNDAPNSPTDVSPAALAILDHLQSTGERDRLKEWLIRELTSCGWVDTLYRKAHQIGKAQASTTDQPLATNQLAAKLSDFGRDAVPELIRAQLMAQMLEAARAFAAKHAAPNENSGVDEEE